MKMLSNVNFISMAIKKVFFQPQFQSFQRNTPFEGIIMKRFGANKSSVHSWVIISQGKLDWPEFSP